MNDREIEMSLHNGRACLNGSITVPYIAKTVLWGTGVSIVRSISKSEVSSPSGYVAHLRISPISPDAQLGGL